MNRHMAWVVLGLVACSGSPGVDGGSGGGGGTTGTGGGGGGGSTASLTETQYCAGRGDPLCEAQVRCGVYETTAGCQQALDAQRLEYGLDECTVGRAATADGRQRFDGTAAAACLASLPTSACQTTSLCTGIFSPQVPQGGSCFDTRDCVSGTYCHTSTSCPGTCQPRVLANQVLGAGQQCLEGLYTAFATVTDGGVGFELRCKAPASAGQPCVVDNILSCVTGLACDPASNTCIAARQAGEVCGTTDGGALVGGGARLCDRSLSCQPGTDGFRRCAGLAGVNEACGTCKFDLRCLKDGGVDGVCAPKGETGAPCTLPNDCAFGYFCLPTSGMPFTPGTCQPRQPLGATCRSRTDCQLGLDCDFRPAADGGVLPELRCVTGDGGTASGACADRTP